MLYTRSLCRCKSCPLSAAILQQATSGKGERDGKDRVVKGEEEEESSVEEEDEKEEEPYEDAEEEEEKEVAVRGGVFCKRLIPDKHSSFF